MPNENLDPAALALTEEQIELLTAAKRKDSAEIRILSRKEQLRRKRSVPFPEGWVQELASIRASASTYRVALYLLRRKLITGSSTITLGNGGLRIDGVGRQGKGVALQELEAAGLITVQYRAKRSPVVTLAAV
jgi:hypothetical protein